MCTINAGIVTYNPDMDRLSTNVEAIIKQVDYLTIVDNASDNITDIDEFCASKGVNLIKNNKNMGVQEH